MGATMGMTAIKNCLRGVPLFADLADAELDYLASTARSMSYRKGARIFEEGALADCCYVLFSGRAKVVLDSDDGVEILLGTVAAGDLVGEMALLDGSTRSAALVALESSHVIRIPGAAFDTVRRNPVFERKLVARVTTLVREMNEHVRQVSTGPSLARVAWCIGRIAEREGRRDGKAVIIPRRPRSEELAGMAGCRRETVSRALSELKRKKYVSWDTQTMRLEDGFRRFLRTPSAQDRVPDGTRT